MNPKAKVKLIWPPPSEGGRKKIMPVGMRYCPVIIAKPLEATGSNWSVAVVNKTIEGLASEAEIAFMSPEAPHDVLAPGLPFDLYEGQNLVASGNVI